MRVRTGRVRVNGIDLYFEVHGSGRPVVSIALGGGDAGGVRPVANLVADRLSVFAYDRRGCSRSSRPPTWKTTSIDEQADDAAGFIDALGLGPAVVYGTSSGAVIGLNLALRYPHLVSMAIVHEPIVATPNSRVEVSTALAKMRSVAEDCGPRRAMEMITVLYQDDPDLRVRLMGNAEVFYDLEVPALAAYALDAQTLSRCEVPIIPVVSADCRANWFGRTTSWIAQCLGVEEREVPGGHASPWTHPEAIAAVLLAEILRGNRGSTWHGQP